MGNGCCGISVQRARSFLTKEERIGMINQNKDYLEKEAKGVSDRIKDLEKE